MNQELVIEFLADTPFVVTIAANGVQAVEAFSAQQFDLVLMDCQMPVMDGFEATRNIRKFEQERSRSRTPIIAVTANAIRGDRELCLAAGMDDYISKPFGPETLLDVLTKWAGRETASS